MSLMEQVLDEVLDDLADVERDEVDGELDQAIARAERKLDISLCAEDVRVCAALAYEQLAAS